MPLYELSHVKITTTTTDDSFLARTPHEAVEWFRGKHGFLPNSVDDLSVGPCECGDFVVTDDSDPPWTAVMSDGSRAEFGSDTEDNRVCPACWADAKRAGAIVPVED